MSLRRVLLHVTSCPQTTFRAAVIERVYALLKMKFSFCMATTITESLQMETEISSF